jgi:hypothetical protein
VTAVGLLVVEVTAVTAVEAAIGTAVGLLVVELAAEVTAVDEAELFMVVVEQYHCWQSSDGSKVTAHSAMLQGSHASKSTKTLQFSS